MDRYYAALLLPPAWRQRRAAPLPRRGHAARRTGSCRGSARENLSRGLHIPASSTGPLVGVLADKIFLSVPEF